MLDVIFVPEILNQYSLTSELVIKSEIKTSQDQ